MRQSHRISKLLATAASVLLGGFFVQPFQAQDGAQSGPEFTDLHGYSMEAPAIKNMVDQGIMNVTAPGKFDPGTTVKRADFAIALRRMFSLPQPGKPIKFSDVHPSDAIYADVEAVAPYMDKQVPCPGCEVGSAFSPNKAISRAQWAITVVRILVAQNKLQLLSEEQSNKILSSVPDVRDVPKGARVYIATAIDSDIIECCSGNAIAVDQIPSRADVADMLNNIQKHFNLSRVKQGA